MANPAANISINAGAGEWSGLEQVRTMDRDASAAWSRAQTKESKLRMSGVQLVSIGSDFRAFPRIEKREYKLRTTSIQRTTLSPAEYDRRVLTTESYTDTIGIDMDDIVVSPGTDIFADAMAQQENAAGRLIDQTALFSCFSVAHAMSTSSREGISPLGVRSHTTFLNSLQKQYQLNLYHVGKDTNRNIKGFVAKDLERVKHIFRKRNVVDQIVCGLTPDLSLLLRTDDQFVNRENLFNPSEQVQSGMYSGFEYRGFKMLPILDDVLISPSVNYLGGGVTGLGSGVAAVQRDAANYVFARDLTLTANISPIESTTAPVLGTAPLATSTEVTVGGTAAFGGTALTKVGSAVKDSGIHLVKRDIAEQSIVHFWIPRALKFAQRDALIMRRRDERLDLEYAKQLYSRVSFGCICIDPDYTVGVILEGNVARGSE